MKLELIDKQLIWLEYKAFEAYMYNGKSKEDRDALGQFFTPADLTIKMLEALDYADTTEFAETSVIDPTSGSGNLLAAAFLLGVPANELYGNEYDAGMVIFCRARIKAIPERLKEAIMDSELIKEVEKLTGKINKSDIEKKITVLEENIKAFKYYQIHQGNALQKRCLKEFSDWYVRHYDITYIDDLDYAQGTYPWTIDDNPLADGTENKEAIRRASVNKNNSELSSAVSWEV